MSSTRLRAEAVPTTRSVWQDTRTFFPLFVDVLTRRQAGTVCVVGASDGKFVLPLARSGVRVVAVERDPLAVNGGPVTLPGPTQARMPGLRQRLDEEGLTGLVDVVQADLFDAGWRAEPFDAIWTSCSWHYSVNHARPLASFIGAMVDLCRPHGGLFGAEYMMPVEPRHLDIEHYPEQGEVRRFFRDWIIDWETYTTPFLEAPHVEQLTEHVHRMGLIIATRQ
jgi:SAM-dependent methyltransferase